MMLTDDRNGSKSTKNTHYCAIKDDTCDFFNRRTVANIRRTEHAVMDCPQWLWLQFCIKSDRWRVVIVYV